MTTRPILRSVLGLIISYQSSAFDWRGLYHSGEAKLRRGMAEEASRELRQSLREAESENVSSSQKAAILDALGRARFRLAKYREAAGYFEMSVQFAEQPTDRVPGLVNAAQAYRELGEYGKSEKCASTALQHAPNDGRIWQLLGSVLIKSRRFEEAKAAEQKALAFGDSNVTALAWSDLSLIEDAQGRYAEAVSYLRRAIDALPPGHERGRLLVNLGLQEHRARRANEAVSHLSQAVSELESVLGKAHPDLAQALDSYAEVLRHAGRKPEARKATQRAMEIRSSLAATVNWQDLKSPPQD